MVGSIKRKSHFDTTLKYLSTVGFLFFTLFSVQAQDENKVTQAEIAHEFAQAVNSQDVDLIANYIDFKGFGKIITSKLSASDKIKHALMEQYQSTQFARTFANSSFIMQPDTVATMDFKKIIPTKQFGNLPMLRLDYETGGHEFILLFINDSNKIEDFFYASKGNLVSSAVAGTTQLLLPAQNDFISRLLGRTVDSKETLEKFQKMLALRQQGKFDEVHKLLQSFPEELLSQRELVDFNILISQSVSDEAYVEALHRLNKYHGNDESTSFMLVDFYVETEDFEEAMRSTDKAIAFWGNDAALVHLKANIAYLMDDKANAIEFSKEAISIEPDYEEPYWTLVSLQEESKDFDGINQSLALMQQQFDETFTPDRVSEFFSLPGYEASSAYKAALERNSFLP
jgi:tetratricopeptide (TPR) repeat protein